jgi:hypothetical protein
MAIAELDPSTSDVKAERPTRMRYFMLFFILVATIINYVDRTNLGIATPSSLRNWGSTRRRWDKFSLPSV